LQYEHGSQNLAHGTNVENTLRGQWLQGLQVDDAACSREQHAAATNDNRAYARYILLLPHVLKHRLQVRRARGSKGDQEQRSFHILIIAVISIVCYRSQ